MSCVLNSLPARAFIFVCFCVCFSVCFLRPSHFSKPSINNNTNHIKQHSKLTGNMQPSPKQQQKDDDTKRSRTSESETKKDKKEESDEQEESFQKLLSSQQEILAKLDFKGDCEDDEFHYEEEFEGYDCSVAAHPGTMVDASNSTTYCSTAFYDDSFQNHNSFQIGDDMLILDDDVSMASKDLEVDRDIFGDATANHQHGHRSTPDIGGTVEKYRCHPSELGGSLPALHSGERRMPPQSHNSWSGSRKRLYTDESSSPFSRAPATAYRSHPHYQEDGARAGWTVATQRTPRRTRSTDGPFPTTWSRTKDRDVFRQARKRPTLQGHNSEQDDDLNDVVAV
jgi:hypothetical protein